MKHSPAPWHTEPALGGVPGVVVYAADGYRVAFFRSYTQDHANIAAVLDAINNLEPENGKPIPVEP